MFYDMVAAQDLLQDRLQSEKPGQQLLCLTIKYFPAERNIAYHPEKTYSGLQENNSEPHTIIIRPQNIKISE